MIYYKNETLYIEIIEELNEMKYFQIKQKLTNLIYNYGVDKIVVFNHMNGYKNRYFLRKIKSDFEKMYHGDLILE